MQRNAVLESAVLCFAATLAAVFASTSASAQAHSIDWSGVEAKEIRVFQTGQASWEWLLTAADHSGGPKIRLGRTCADCHAGEETEIGELIASGEKIEPHPVAARRASFPLKVQFAHDGARIHVRLEWPEVPESSGEKMNPDRPGLVTLLIDDGNVKPMGIAGCWATCHADLPGMPSADTDTDTELTKYLTASRTKVTRKGGGENYRSAAELKERLAQGTFLEFWQTNLRPGGKAVSGDGYILDRRHGSENPEVAAKATLRDGRWVVEMSRALELPEEPRKQIISGKKYVFGIALHEDHAAGRFHHVSLMRSFALDRGDADFNVVGQ